MTDKGGLQGNHNRLQQIKNFTCLSQGGVPLYLPFLKKNAERGLQEPELTTVY